jgi:hypothetical protein
MSILKSEQRDERTFWQWVRGRFFHASCPSYIAHAGYDLKCALPLGHEGKHLDKGTFWGYGDNWLDSEEW